MTEYLFWTIVFLIGFAMAGYPVLVLVLRALIPSSSAEANVGTLSVDIVIPAYNEGSVIEDKLINTLDQAASSAHAVRILILSDGSTDETLEKARAVSDPSIEVIDLQPRRGKATALNTAIELLSADIVVFTDANSMLVPGALEALLSHYGDPGVGGVCGAIQVAKSTGSLAASEGIYWRYDQAVKAAESRLGGAVSAQGTLHSLRREHVRPVPLDAADDFTLSVQAVADGRHLVFEPRAVGIEKVTERVAGEFSRRVRSTERGWRALMNNARLLNPALTGFYAFQLFSHKLLRRIVPFLMLLTFSLNLLLLNDHWIYKLIFAAQVLVYGIGFIALFVPVFRRLSGVRHVFFGLMALTAVGLGILNFYGGRKSTVWAPVRD